METAKKFAFVLMPFTSEFDDVYRLGIQDAARAHGVIAERVDEQIYTESILERIYRQIESADMIIADMSGRNPNVFYEVGYAHAKGKLCTLLTRDASDIPFDLKHHRHIVYGNSINRLKELLSGEISWVLEEIERRKVATFDIKISHDDGALAATEYVVDGSFSMTIDIHNRTAKRSPEIEAMYLQTSDAWTFDQGGTECPKSGVDGSKGRTRHFVRAPVTRLSPGAWAQVKLEGKRRLWTKWSGEERQEQFRVRGTVKFEIATSEGTYPVDQSVDVGFDEIPF